MTYSSSNHLFSLQFRLVICILYQDVSSLSWCLSLVHFGSTSVLNCFNYLSFALVFTLSPDFLGWNHQETIDSLLRKGGYKGSINETVRSSVRLTRYRSDELQLHAGDYFAEQANGYRV